MKSQKNLLKIINGQLGINLVHMTVYELNTFLETINCKQAAGHNRILLKIHWTKNFYYTLPWLCKTVHTKTKDNREREQRLHNLLPYDLRIMKNKRSITFTVLANKVSYAFALQLYSSGKLGQCSMKLIYTFSHSDYFSSHGKLIQRKSRGNTFVCRFY